MTNKKEQTKIIKKILRKVIDPELGIDIVSLGLIDKVVIRNNYIEVQMVFTFPGCPFMSTLLSQVRDILQEKFPDYKIEVKVLEKEWKSPKNLAKVMKAQNQKLLRKDQKSNN